MIRVKQFDQICQQIKVATEIDGYKICSTEEQGMKKLYDSPGIRLVAVYPSHSFDGTEDNYVPTHEMLFYMVTKQKEGEDEETELNQYTETQDAIIKLKEFLFGENNQSHNHCKLFPNLVISSVIIDPEYNIFGGFLGWSLKLVC